MFDQKMDSTKEQMKAELFAVNLHKGVKFFDFKNLLQHVDEVKQERILRFYRDEDKLRCLLGDLLVRMALMERLNVSNSVLNPRLSEYGKPHFSSIDLHFNISHAGDWVVCAIHDQPVGVDVEQVIPIDLAISASFFAESEHEDILNSIDQEDRFFDFWSLKESFIKQIGKGLSQELNSFTVKFLNRVIRIESRGQLLENVFLKQFALEEGYKFAICTANEALPEDVQIIQPNKIKHFFQSHNLNFNH